jgi:hypothetical protein
MDLTLFFFYVKLLFPVLWVNIPYLIVAMECFQCIFNALVLQNWKI